jgi:hypothetical protein
MTSVKLNKGLMDVAYPVCPQCGNQWLGRLRGPGWFYCAVCMVELRREPNGIAIYAITADGDRDKIRTVEADIAEK